MAAWLGRAATATRAKEVSDSAWAVAGLMQKAVNSSVGRVFVAAVGHSSAYAGLAAL